MLQSPLKQIFSLSHFFRDVANDTGICQKRHYRHQKGGQTMLKQRPNGGKAELKMMLKQY